MLGLLLLTLMISLKKLLGLVFYITTGWLFEELLAITVELLLVTAVELVLV